MSKINIFTNADFGNKTNLKTKEVSHIIKPLDKNIENIYCRSCYGVNDKRYNALIPFQDRIPKIMYVLGLYNKTHNLFDWFASKKKIDNGSINIYYPHKFYNTIKKNKKNFNIGFIASILELKFQYLKYFNYILVLSDYNKELLLKKKIPKEKIYITPLGVDTERFKPGKKKDDVFRIIAVANYGLLKGFQYLLKAWEELNLKNAELIFVGNPSKEMKKTTKEYKKKLDNFRTVPHTDPVVYYQNSSLLVHPSLTEGSAKVIYEAMSCGLPVITTFESGSVVRDKKDGFIIPARNSNAIKEKILYFHNNPEKIKEMGKNARENILKNYTWDHFSERVYKIIKDICKKEGLKLN
ncbi:glycosyltransferase family 4 protein [Candidatus Woesearchaeota archaeon]|nr:glycosyltransferase family 4 protein [Candidatus Woesearchaeota archaeon]